MTIATHDPPKIPGRRVRIERLKTQIMARKGSFVEDVNPFLRSVALWRASQGERSRMGQGRPVLGFGAGLWSPPMLMPAPEPLTYVGTQTGALSRSGRPLLRANRA